MLKARSDTICKPLEIILKQVLLTGTCPLEWKNGMKCFYSLKNVTNVILNLGIYNQSFIDGLEGRGFF